jgi:hypothetical protein
MEKVRRLHLYLACLFSPLLIFFVVTGAWQTFRLHQSRKDGSYTAPAALQRLSAVHTDQKFPVHYEKTKVSVPLRWFVIAMSAGFVLMAASGIAMAFQVTRPKWKVWVWLALGLILPVLLLCLGGGLR